MAEPVIQFQNACKKYGDTYALQPVTLDIASGEFLSIVGSSGGGKTTLLKLINGLLLPTSGKVLVMGQDTTQVDLIQLRRQIGYVPGLSGQKLSGQRLEELMKLVDLPVNLLQRYPISLSGGQQQRVGIARALASQPRIMLMDEPFGAVDEITRTVLQDSIQELHQKLQTTIVFVTHNIREALRLSDRVMIINHGEIQQLDTPANIQASPANEYVERLLR